ncbi:hypothetical protein E1301_Tti019830 [Triplophysa tibetana]|uniref:Uncharacterized protein n=1 Tax=Triplophysa tibetana TaxID=1572043 RepID=A0A5A9PDI5_9TELE|nr:hypothetical protein E1301_Tti019830 [Triplophysa tibetana]
MDCFSLSAPLRPSPDQTVPMILITRWFLISAGPVPAGIIYLFQLPAGPVQISISQHLLVSLQEGPAQPLSPGSSVVVSQPFFPGSGGIQRPLGSPSAYKHRWIKPVKDLKVGHCKLSGGVEAISLQDVRDQAG